MVSLMGYQNSLYLKWFNTEEQLSFEPGIKKMEETLVVRQKMNFSNYAAVLCCWYKEQDRIDEWACDVWVIVWTILRWICVVFVAAYHETCNNHPPTVYNVGFGTPAFNRDPAFIGHLAFIRTLAMSPMHLLLLFVLGLC